MRCRYDLHIHTCLSPCGDEDMTPNNIVNMAMLKGLDLIAVCDHNTTRNCGAVIHAAENNGLDLTVIPGIEVTTSEDIHVLVYFPGMTSAAKFENEVIEPRRVKIKNKPEIFGEQIIMNDKDEPVGMYEWLLINAVGLSVDELPDIAAQYGGIAVPAHVDKNANGLIAVLGTIPDYLNFPVAEVKNKSKNDDIINMYGKKILNNSDAHFLWDMTEDENVAIEIEGKNEWLKYFL